MLHGYRQLYSLHNTKYIYLVIAKDIETRFKTSNYELKRPLPRGKNKVIGLMKDGKKTKCTKKCHKAKT